MHCRYTRLRRRVMLAAASPALMLFLAACPSSGPGGAGGSGSNQGGTDGDPTEPRTFSVEVTTVGQGTVIREVDGASITLRPQPADGWVFDRWTDAGLSDPRANPLTLSADDGITSITANFVEEGGGSVEPVPDDADADNVPDAQDQCPDSPQGQQVNDVGCAPSERDTDADLVNDDVDNCPGTPAGTTVDDKGCPVSVDGTVDSDGDNVPDDVDRCDDTPAGVSVDANGCPDADGDGVADTADACPATPGGAPVDASGCAESERDSDGDNVNDNVDECPNTGAGVEVDDQGCPDSDHDGVRDGVDTCPGTTAGEAVNADGCSARQLSGGGGGGGGGGGDTNGGEDGGDGNQTCGNAILDPGEDCDDANTTPGDWCDENCKFEPITNDDCANATPVDVGTISFSNGGATTDGPDEPGPCALEGVSQIDADVWFLFVSPCTDNVVVSACGSSFDTKLAVYEGDTCPVTTSIACSDDDCGPEVGSRVLFPAQSGQSYLIRIGGYLGDMYLGAVTIYCDSDPAFGVATCGISSGDCLVENSGPGCSDGSCCTSMCVFDPFCCDTLWDARCAEKAEQIICRDTPPDACQPAAGDCNNPVGNGSPGCEEPACCQAVCRRDSYCCLTEWDDICADIAQAACGSYVVCETATGDCLAQQSTPGCQVQSCCNAVCSIDPACCTNAWDDLCAETARTTTECQ
ncbi:MAG: thrombospondin type 3 repeat-containing protein [Phycisphaerae bacterium]